MVSSFLQPTYLLFPDIFDHIYDIDSIEVTFGEFDPMTGNYISWLDGGRNAGIIIEPNSLSPAPSKDIRNEPTTVVPKCKKSNSSAE